MTAVEITFMCLVVFAPLLVWFVVLLVRNKDLPRDGENTESFDDNFPTKASRSGYIHDPKYTGMAGNIYNND